MTHAHDYGVIWWKITRDRRPRTGAPMRRLRLFLRLILARLRPEPVLRDRWGNEIDDSRGDSR